jgi:ABC-type Fe3+-hydroxamate transport system substrate-binding protein
MRVVSLVPSATELVCLIGGREMLVGRSHECDWPPGLDGVPVLTAARTGPGLSPGATDAAVRAQLAGGESLYTLDLALLGEIRPDVILTQDLCEVCSIDLGTVREAAARMSPPPRVVSLNPQTVEDVLDDVLRVGEALGLGRAAAEAVVRLRGRMYRAAEHVNPYADGPGVAFLEWTDPIYIGGHWTPQLIERAGGRHPLNPTVAAEGSGAAAGPQAAYRRAGKSVRVLPEVLAASRPERVIICPCGVGLEDACDMAGALAMEPWFARLPAARANRVAVVDGNQMFNRPGPRLVDAFEWLVGWLNGVPGLIPAGFPWVELRNDHPGME